MRSTIQGTVGQSATVLLHPNHAGSAVVNPRIRGRKKGVVSLMQSQRERTSEVSQLNTNVAPTLAGYICSVLSVDHATGMRYAALVVAAHADRTKIVA